MDVIFSERRGVGMEKQRGGDFGIPAGPGHQGFRAGCPATGGESSRLRVMASGRSGHTAADFRQAGGNHAYTGRHRRLARLAP